MGLVNSYQNNKGVVLVTVIIFSIILSILAISVLFVMTNEARITEFNIRRIQANYAAQAGFQNYLELLKTNPAPPATVISVSGVSVTTEMFPAGSFPAGCPQEGVSSNCIVSTAGPY